MKMRSIGLIAKSVLTESVRRRELYVLVLAACALIGVIMTMDFFGLGGLTKFYREAALKVMSWTTALAVIALAARQLPRELENRTIYPLLARPLSRTEFLGGKLLGVLAAGAFCFALFMLIFVAGSLRMRVPIPWGLFLQHIYLQLLMVAVIGSLGFLLSMLMHVDAVITICVLFYFLSAVSATVLIHLHAYMGAAGRALLLFLNYAIPQITLFDLSEKAVHAEVWPRLGWGTMGALTLYAGIYVAIYLVMTVLLFRRRAL